MIKKVKAFFRDDNGATAIEYGLIAALISVVIIVAITAVGGSLTDVFEAVDAALQTGLGGGGV